MDAIAIQQKVRALVEQSVVRAGYELVAVEWFGGSHSPILRLSIDAVDGVTADDCGVLSALLSPVLDEANPIDSRYHLEVSSPGIDRPVQRVEDYHRFLGYRVALRLVPGHPRRRYKGLITAVDGEEICIAVDGVEHQIALSTVERAHLVLDLDQYQRLAEGTP